MTTEQYIMRHDRVWVKLHFYKCKEMGLTLDNEYKYDHVRTKSVETDHEGNVTVLRNQKVQTDSTVPNNKPDITNRNMYVNRCCNFRRQKCDREKRWEDSKK
jgi:hypothetical protein